MSNSFMIIFYLQTLKSKSDFNRPSQFNSLRAVTTKGFVCVRALCPCPTAKADRFVKRTVKLKNVLCRQNKRTLTQAFFVVPAQLAFSAGTFLACGGFPPALFSINTTLKGRK